MRKQELIHLHTLLVQIRTTLTADYEPPADAFAAYDHHGVHPRAIYARKEAHEEAITHLTTGIDRVLTDRPHPGTDPEDGPPPAESLIES